jgi:hypothetical protein
MSFKMKNEIDYQKELDELEKLVDEMSKKQKEANDTLDKKECCICMDEKPSCSFELSSLVCGHSFCGDCMDKCNENNGKCPLCRCPLTTEGANSALTDFFNDNIHLYQMIDIGEHLGILNLKQGKFAYVGKSLNVFIFCEIGDPGHLFLQKCFKVLPLIIKGITHRVIQTIQNNNVEYTLEELRQIAN